MAIRTGMGMGLHVPRNDVKQGPGGRGGDGPRVGDGEGTRCAMRTRPSLVCSVDVTRSRDSEGVERLRATYAECNAEEQAIVKCSVESIVASMAGSAVEAPGEKGEGVSSSMKDRLGEGLEAVDDELDLLQVWPVPTTRPGGGGKGGARAPSTAWHAFLRLLKTAEANRRLAGDGRRLPPTPVPPPPRPSPGRPCGGGGVRQAYPLLVRHFLQPRVLQE